MHEDLKKHFGPKVQVIFVVLAGDIFENNKAPRDIIMNDPDYAESVRWIYFSGFDLELFTMAHLWFPLDKVTRLGKHV